MADPRSNIVLSCPPSYLGRSAAASGASTADRRTFFEAAGKTGNLEVLNSVGAGKVGQGLRTLASISNTIRQGCGSLPTSLGGALGAAADATSEAVTAGSDWVLQQMGMNISTANAVQAFNPAIANQALGQARQVYDRVRRGTFKARDIPSVLQDFKNLERLASNIFTPSILHGEGAKIGPQCEASPYAIDLIARAPKHKFMFIAQFVPNLGYESLGQLDWAFTIQNSSRPSIRYQIEDVNYYNFRSKLITKTEFEPMTMKFYDDIRDQTGQFYAAILKSMTPVANFASAAEFNTAQDSGMEFTDTNGPIIDGVSFKNSRYSGSTGLLLENNKTIFKEIILYHVFDAGRKMDAFHFYNPRLTELKLDDLAMSETGATSLDITFAYDTVFVDTNLFFGGDEAASARAASAGVGNSSFYSLKYNESPKAASGPSNTGLSPFGSPVPSTDSCGTTVNTSNPNTNVTATIT